jgi:hypothetical protein
MYRERIYGVAVKIEPARRAPTLCRIRPSTPCKPWAFRTSQSITSSQGTRDDVQNGTLINADRTTAAGRFGKITITTR